MENRWAQPGPSKMASAKEGGEKKLVLHQQGGDQKIYNQNSQVHPWSGVQGPLGI